MTGCAASQSEKPDLPASASPGWRLGTVAPTAKPAGVPEAPVCWSAEYTESTEKGKSTAEVTICAYQVETSAFDASQRFRAEAQTVKFQVGRYLVLVKWNDAPMTDITALTRAIERALGLKTSPG